MKKKEFDVKDLSLADKGNLRIEWASMDMPVLSFIRKEFRKKRPLEGIRISACLHVTTETANLMIALKEGGAKVVLCASNPLSTQDDVAAALVKYYDIPVFAIKGEDRDTYYQHLLMCARIIPHITMDDGADLVSLIHSDREDLAENIIGGTEETTTGVIRLRALEKEGKLKYPIIAVNDADTKHLFDNRYGTGQSTIDGILRSTNRLLAGSTVVVCGYGWCGKGVARRADGMGSRVIVCEVDPVRALEAIMDGFEVMPIKEAAKIGDIFITVTGNIHVIREEHFKLMKDGAIVANSGHFNVEIDISALEKLKQRKRQVRDFVEEYTLAGGKRIYLLGQGRLINLSAGEGHPACVMDMSFANQILSVEYLVRNAKKMENKVYKVPEKIDQKVASLKLKTLGVKIDSLTSEQKEYLNSWKMGT